MNIKTNMLKDLRKRYQAEEINKSEYIESMHKNRHSIIFEYAEFIKNTNIKKIEIEDGQVIMTSRDRGIRILCNELDHRIAPIETLNFLDYEKEESRMMENLIGEDYCFFDIGANIGWHSLNIAAAKRGVEIFCFEPIPKTYEHLLKNIAINSSSRLKAFNFGLGSNSGEFTFYYYPEGSGNASSSNLTNRSDVEQVVCKVKTLDAFVKENKIRVDFIKCDVEGAELFVFEGGIEVLTRDKPIVFSEILRKWSKNFNYDPNKIFNLFYSLEYSSFVVHNGNLVNFNLMDEHTIETNFFFLHKVKHQDLIKRYLQ